MNDQLDLLAWRQPAIGGETIQGEESIHLEIAIGHAASKRLNRITPLNRHNIDDLRADAGRLARADPAQ